MITEAAIHPKPPRELRKVSDRRASRNQHRQRAAGVAAASADFWVDPTDCAAKGGIDAELSQEVMALRARISSEISEIAQQYTHPNFDEEQAHRGRIDRRRHEANIALQAFPHLRALQGYAAEIEEIAAVTPLEEPQLIPQQAQIVHRTKDTNPLSMDDFWEEIAAASPGQRLVVLSDLLAPPTMPQFVVATNTLFHIRSLLEDEDQPYLTATEAHPLVVQLALALEDAQPRYLPAIVKLMRMFASHAPLKQLMYRQETVPILQSRKRSLRDEAITEELQLLLRMLIS